MIGGVEAAMLALTLPLYLGIPAVLIYLVVKAFRRIFRQLDQIHEELQSLSSRSGQAGSP